MLRKSIQWGRMRGLFAAPKRGTGIPSPLRSTLAATTTDWKTDTGVSPRFYHSLRKTQNQSTTIYHNQILLGMTGSFVSSSRRQSTTIAISSTEANANNDESNDEQEPNTADDDVVLDLSLREERLRSTISWMKQQAEDNAVDSNATNTMSDDGLLENSSSSSTNGNTGLATEFQFVLSAYSNKFMKQSNGSSNTSNEGSKADDKNASHNRKQLLYWMDTMCETIRMLKKRHQKATNNNVETALPSSVPILTYNDVPFRLVIRSLCTPSSDTNNSNSVAHLKTADQYAQLAVQVIGNHYNSNQVEEDVYTNADTVCSSTIGDRAKIYESMVLGWCTCRGNNNTPAAVEAEKWLKRWLNDDGIIQYLSTLPSSATSSNNSVYPNILLISSMIDCWANSTQRDAPLRAERWLNLLLRDTQLDDDHYNDKNASDKDSFSSTKNSNNPIIIQNPNNNRVQYQALSRIKPNTVTYTSVIHAWSRADGVDGSYQISHHNDNRGGNRNGTASHIYPAERAEYWLRRMERDYYQNGNIDAQPNVLSYTSVMNAFARSCYNSSSSSGSKHGRKRKDGNDTSAQDDSANPVESASKAENVLLRMLDLAQKTSQLQQNSDQHDGNNNVNVINPDIVAYNTIIDAWARVADRDANAALNAERWLRLLLASGNSSSDVNHDGIAGPMLVTNNEAIVPDVVSYNGVINAYARAAKSSFSPDDTSGMTNAAERANYWFQEMKYSQRIQPTSISYGSVMKAFANSKITNLKKDDNVGHTERLLQEYEMDARKGLIEPSSVAYNTVLLAYSNSKRRDAIDGASALLKRMELYQQLKSDGETNIDGTTIAISDTTSSPADHDNDMIIPAIACPDIVSYNTFLRICAMNKPHNDNFRQKAMRTSLITFDKLCSNNTTAIQLQPNTFSMMLFCINKLSTPHEKKQRKYFELCRLVFQQCRDRGLVNKYVLNALKVALRDTGNGATNGIGFSSLSQEQQHQQQQLDMDNYREIVGDGNPFHQDTQSDNSIRISSSFSRNHNRSNTHHQIDERSGDGTTNTITSSTREDCDKIPMRWKRHGMIGTSMRSQGPATRQSMERSKKKKQEFRSHLSR